MNATTADRAAAAEWAAETERAWADCDKMDAAAAGAAWDAMADARAERDATA